MLANRILMGGPKNRLFRSNGWGSASTGSITLPSVYGAVRVTAVGGGGRGGNGQVTAGLVDGGGGGAGGAVRATYSMTGPITVNVAFTSGGKATVTVNSSDLVAEEGGSGDSGANGGAGGTGGSYTAGAGWTVLDSQTGGNGGNGAVDVGGAGGVFTTFYMFQGGTLPTDYGTGADGSQGFFPNDPITRAGVFVEWGF